MKTLTVNSIRHEVDAPDNMPLLWVIRDLIELKGTKFGCGAGLCGACTVHLNGAAVRACQTTLEEASHGEITTIESIGSSKVGARIQAAWQKLDVPQCGYCQPGQIMSATALLSKTPKPSDSDIDAAMAGNICRCGTYNRIRAAIHVAAEGSGS